MFQKLYYYLIIFYFRHNEDTVQNPQLAQMCPIDTASRSMESPNTKAYLLLQAHFSRLALPCSDYYTDLKSVLDQTIRILQVCIIWFCILLRSGLPDRTYSMYVNIRPKFYGSEYFESMGKWMSDQTWILKKVQLWPHLLWNAARPHVPHFTMWTNLNVTINFQCAFPEIST